MSDGRSRRASLEDLKGIPDHLIGEILEGEVVTSPRPTIRQANASSVLGSNLVSAFHLAKNGPGGWWILDEPEIHLGNNIIVPNIAGWRRDRMATLPDAAWIDVAPDWVCEVISPATGHLDRVRKLPIYGKNWIPHLWLVDPALRTIEIYRLNVSGWLLIGAHGDDQLMRAEPFDAVDIDLTPLWGGGRASENARVERPRPADR